MPDYITPEGIEIPSLEDIQTQIAEEQRAAPVLGPLVANDPESLLGQMNAIEASKDRDAWEAVQTAFWSLNRNKAEDAVLDGLNAITGTTRAAAKPTRFVGSKKLLVTMTAGAIITKDVTKFAVTGSIPLRVFVAKEDFTAPIDDDFRIEAWAEIPGPFPANAGTVTTIVTPTTGVSAVVNNFDAVIGSYVESDEAFRARADEEVSQSGGSTVPGLKADLLALEEDDETHPILAVDIIENIEDTFDFVTGLPPHSFEPVIWDGVGQDAEDEDIAEIIKANRPAGIKNVGDEELSIDGVPYRWSRPTQIQTEIAITLYKDSSYAGDTAVKTAVATLFQLRQAPARVVPYSRYSAAALAVLGVTRIDQVELNFVGDSPVVNEDLPVPPRYIAVSDSTLITVTALDDPDL